MHADAGYVGVEKREETAEEDPTGRIDWQIAKRRSGEAAKSDQKDGRWSGKRPHPGGRKSQGLGARVR